MEEMMNETTELAPVEESTGLSTIWTDDAKWKVAMSRVKALAASDLVPDNYKNKPANCLIALDLSNRMKVSPLMVMQNLYVVKGKPAWSGSYCISAVNNSGFYSPLEFIRILDDKGEVKGYYAQATDLRTGRVCEGSPVTWDMVKGEGWYDKPGSKWKTMPDQMFRYRAASFFVRAFCPEILNGIQEVGEVQDVNGYDVKNEPTVISIVEE